jgi:energy-converting hydrogenase Eha subunit C
MSKLSSKLGFWASVLIAFAFIVYTISLSAILLFFRIPHWTSLPEFVASTSGTWFPLYSACQFLAFLTPPLFVLLINSIHDKATFEEKTLTRASLCFAVIFATLSSINYFVQFSTVRLGMLHGRPEGLEAFIQLNPDAVITAFNILGWTVFFGLSSLFIVPLFSSGKLEKVIKFSFLVNGIICFLGAIGYVFEINILNTLFFYGMGAAVIVISISSSIWFKRLNKLADSSLVK